MPSRDRRAAGKQDYLLSLTAEEKQELEDLADRAGVPLSVALREGARDYLEDLVGEGPGETQTFPRPS